MQSSLELTVGRLLCGTLRDYLQGEMLLHPDLRFHESKGWIERDFKIVGNADTIMEIRMDIAALLKKMGKDD